MESGTGAEIKPVLLISASDSSAAAGMQVDLRVVNDLGASARCCLTAVTVQGDGGAVSVDPVKPDTVTAAITRALEDSPGIGSVKVGLMGDQTTAAALSDPLSRMHGQGIPVVVDPVMRSTPGSELSTSGAVETMLGEVIPCATVVTPNRDELQALSRLAGARIDVEADMAGRLLSGGAGSVLVTGGDTDADQCTDTLYRPGNDVTVFRHPRIGEKAPRGTGCALSTAVAVHLGLGLDVTEAVRRSIEYVAGLIGRAGTVGNQLLLFPGKGRQ